MHEYSIVQSLVRRVETEVKTRGAIGVHRLSISIGELSGVDPELLTTAYHTFRGRTVCEDAELDLTIVAARWTCERCGRPMGPNGLLQCEVCGGPATLAEGDEIMLDRIEMEVP
jgi:hydrogenase nickel incorporation protein HypA/HybF